MVMENGQNASTSKPAFDDPVIDLKTCRLVSQGAEAVSMQIFAYE